MITKLVANISGESTNFEIDVINFIQAISSRQQVTTFNSMLNVNEFLD